MNDKYQDVAHVEFPLNFSHNQMQGIPVVHNQNMKVFREPSRLFHFSEKLYQLFKTTFIPSDDSLLFKITEGNKNSRFADHKDGTLVVNWNLEILDSKKTILKQYSCLKNSNVGTINTNFIKDNLTDLTKLNQLMEQEKLLFFKRTKKIGRITTYNCFTDIINSMAEDESLISELSK